QTRPPIFLCLPCRDLHDDLCIRNVHRFHATKIAQHQNPIYPERLTKADSIRNAGTSVVGAQHVYPELRRAAPQLPRAYRSKTSLAGLYLPAHASPGLGNTSAASAGSLCGALITNNTAVRITAAANPVRKVIVSPAPSHPKKSATTGFTNAYVPTRAAVLFFKI